MAPKRPERKAGPLFGAGLIGGGIGFLLYKGTGKLWLAVLTAVTVTVFDYMLVVAITRWRAKRAEKR